VALPFKFALFGAEKFCAAVAEKNFAAQKNSCAAAAKCSNNRVANSLRSWCSLWFQINDIFWQKKICLPPPIYDTTEAL
jgi:hypothetical protein